MGKRKDWGMGKGTVEKEEKEILVMILQTCFRYKETTKHKTEGRGLCAQINNKRSINSMHMYICCE